MQAQQYYPKYPTAWCNDTITAPMPHLQRLQDCQRVPFTDGTTQIILPRSRPMLRHAAERRTLQLCQHMPRNSAAMLITS
jgi:hypothetical protein